jgi:agmatine/peptidylarginine deiminase
VLIPEFAPQSGVLVTWPHKQSDWKDRLEEIEPVYLDIAHTVSTRERLLVICFDETHRRHISDCLAKASIPEHNIRYACAPSNDTWVRDYGPLTVQVDGKPVLQDYAFNAWGGKYASALDDGITGSLYRSGVFGKLEYQRYPLVLEGGSIDVDGRGTLLTTARCLLAPTRNPELGRTGLEDWFHRHMGIEHVLWLQHGALAGDDTDAHVDMLARFCSTDTIAYSRCTDPDDAHYASLQAMEIELQAFRSTTGDPYRLVPLPLPQPIHDENGQRLPGSYANFLIINDAVLLPVYDDPADCVAQQALAACFPDREIIPINCLPLIRQYGSLHCATMQLPAGVLPATGD